MCSEQCHIWGGNFSIFKFSVFTENEKFSFSLKSFPHIFVVSHTLSNSSRLCKFKNLSLFCCKACQCHHSITIYVLTVVL